MQPYTHTLSLSVSLSFFPYLSPSKSLSTFQSFLTASTHSASMLTRSKSRECPHNKTEFQYPQTRSRFHGKPNTVHYANQPILSISWRQPLWPVLSRDHISYISLERNRHRSIVWLNSFLSHEAKKRLLNNCSL